MLTDAAEAKTINSISIYIQKYMNRFMDAREWMIKYPEVNTQFS
jgi:hypothetical protein